MTLEGPSQLQTSDLFEAGVRGAVQRGLHRLSGSGEAQIHPWKGLAEGHIQTSQTPWKSPGGLVKTSQAPSPEFLLQ